MSDLISVHPPAQVLLNTVLVFAIVAGFSALLFGVNSLLAETSQVGACAAVLTA